MTLSLAEIVRLPAAVWLWAVAGMFLAAALGFGAGLWIDRGGRSRALRQARASLEGLTQLAEERLGAAREVCALLEGHPALALSEGQASALKRATHGLAEAFARLLARREAAVELQPFSERRVIEPFSVTWLHEPKDSSGFPDRAAFEANLRNLLEAGNRSDRSSGLMLVKLDRMEALRSRFGAGAERLAQKLGGVLCRAIRDEDLVCRLEEDVFGVFLADVEEEQGQRMAEAIRDSVRHHHFRVDESRDEVLVTASFGYTCCRPWENAELVCNRAGDALSRSQKKGRNQLHKHDGQQLMACASA